MDKDQLNAFCNVNLDSNLNLGASSFTNTSSSSGALTTTCPNTTAYGWWTDWYYPQVIRESYPIYVRERAEDKGRQAYEIIKHLQDKKLMRLDTVRDFIEAMDTLLKIL